MSFISHSYTAFICRIIANHFGHLESVDKVSDNNLGVISYNIHNLLLRYRNRCKNRIQKYSQLSNNTRYDDQQPVNFFRDIIQENKNTEPNIIDHNLTLWDEWFKHIIKIMGEHENIIPWLRYFSSFRYSKELLQHFYSGHKELYSLLMKMVSLESSGNTSEEREEIYKTINNLIVILRQRRELGVQPLHGKCEVCIEFSNLLYRKWFMKWTLRKFKLPQNLSQP